VGFLNYNITIDIAKQSDVLEITSIFKNTIIAVNSKDYGKEQIVLWSSGGDNLDKWKKRIKEHYFIVAKIDSTIVGFAYLTNNNYFDGLFVHHKHQNKGIAKLLLENIEAKVIKNGFDTIHSDVSITALPFFKKHNYIIVEKQQKLHEGLVFENFVVYKSLT